MTLLIVGLTALTVGFVLGLICMGALTGGHAEDHAVQDGGVTDLARAVGVLVDEPAPRERR